MSAEEECCSGHEDNAPDTADPEELAEGNEGALSHDAKKKRKKRSKKKKKDDLTSTEEVKEVEVSKTPSPPPPALSEPPTSDAKVPSTPPRVTGEQTASPSKSNSKAPRGKTKKSDAPEVLLQKLTNKIAELEKQQEQEREEEKALERLYGSDTTGMKEKILKQLRTRKNLEKEVAEVEGKVEAAIKAKERADEDLQKCKNAQKIVENLVNELQAKNKALVDEEKRRIQDEQAKRVDMSSKFQQVLGDITTRMNSAQNEGERGIMENEQLRERLKNLREQMILKDETHKQDIKRCELEIQYFGAQIERRAELAKQYSESSELFIQRANEAKPEGERLRKEVLECSNKFMEYQNALQKSNNEFTSFKNEMNSHSKRMKILDHEIGILKKKHSKHEAIRNEAKSEETQSAIRRKTLEDLIQKLESNIADLQLQQ